ncbi:MAG: cytochrome c maturation protein CcmE, partial [Polyangiales bacterium]
PDRSNDSPDSNEVQPVSVGHQRDESAGVPAIVKVGVVFAILGGALSLLMFGSEASDALVYSKLVNEVLTKPEDFKGRELRVEGELKQGSIEFRESPCEYRFVLGKESKEMAVRFPQCIVPDTFKDGVGLQVSVQGKLTNDGYFLANKVIAKCPSKYEMQERQQRGEQMPHALPRS